MALFLWAYFTDSSLLLLLLPPCLPACNLYHQGVDVFASRVVPGGLETHFWSRCSSDHLFVWFFYELTSGHKHLILMPGSRRCTACTQVSSSCFLPDIQCCPLLQPSSPSVKLWWEQRRKNGGSTEDIVSSLSVLSNGFSRPPRLNVDLLLL